MASVPKLLLVLVFLSYYGSPIAHAGDDASPSHRVVVSVVGSLRTNKSVCSKSKVVRSSSGGATVPLHHRHGPCSPLPTKNKKMPTLEKMLQRDQLRHAYIQRKYFGGGKGAAGVQQSAAVTVPTTLGNRLDTDEYLITVRLGSPARSQTMIIDTGSDVSWVQCKPCFQCHSQVDPLFDPSTSSTYSPFSCSSAACAQLDQDGGSNGCSSSGQCQYFVGYGDRSTTTGTYSSDTLALGSNVVVRNFQFGCSLENSFNDLSDGLMGLGRGAQSLVSQTARTFGTAAFSYCLPPTPSSSGFLTLGAAGTTSSGFVKTPMFPHPTFYVVRLEAIRVGGRQLNIPTWAFSAGTITDSGNVITRLPPTAYWVLSSAFRAGMKQYSSATPFSGFGLGTCYDFSGQSSIRVPSVALVFSGGAVVNLVFDGIMLETETGSGTWCLAFRANSYDSEHGSIGNVQQRTFEVLHDVAGGAMGFRAGAC